MLNVTDFVPATIYTGLGVIIMVEFKTFGDKVIVFNAISVIFIVIGSDMNLLLVLLAIIN